MQTLPFFYIRLSVITGSGKSNTNTHEQKMKNKQQTSIHVKLLIKNVIHKTFQQMKPKRERLQAEANGTKTKRWIKI